MNPDNKVIKTPEALVPTPPDSERIANVHNAPSGSISHIRTFQSDVAEAIKEKQGSVLKIAVAEQERKQVEHNAYSASSPKNKTFIFATIVFLILGASTIAYFVVSRKTPVVQVSNDQTVDPLIFADTTTQVDITDASKPKILDLVRGEVANDSKTAAGKIKYILMTEKGVNGVLPITTERFFNAIDSSASGQLIRALGPDTMPGLFKGSVPRFFVLFKVDSYDNAFAGMYSWEKKMIDDLYALFGIQIVGNNESLVTKAFQTATIQNQDARVLYDDSGHIAFYYTFIGNRGYLLVAEDEDTLKEILVRVGRVNR